jgi:hypothetical protein
VSRRRTVRISQGPDSHVGNAGFRRSPTAAGRGVGCPLARGRTRCLQGGGRRPLLPGPDGLASVAYAFSGFGGRGSCLSNKASATSWAGAAGRQRRPSTDGFGDLDDLVAIMIFVGGRMAGVELLSFFARHVENSGRSMGWVRKDR